MTHSKIAPTIIYLFIFIVPLLIGERSSAYDRTLTIAVSGDLFKKNGNFTDLPPGSTGKLTAQLFDDQGSGDPIWTEVIHDEITLPADNSVATILVLGRRTKLLNPATGMPIQLKDSPWLLLTLEVEGETYRSKRLALLVAGYAHQATEAYEATGKLKGTIDNYEKRIRELERELEKRTRKLNKLIKGFTKLRLETVGTPEDKPVDPDEK